MGAHTERTSLLGSSRRRATFGSAIMVVLGCCAASMLVISRNGGMSMMKRSSQSMSQRVALVTQGIGSEDENDGEHVDESRTITIYCRRSQSAGCCGHGWRSLRSPKDGWWCEKCTAGEGEGQEERRAEKDFERDRGGDSVE